MIFHYILESNILFFMQQWLKSSSRLLRVAVASWWPNSTCLHLDLDLLSWWWQPCGVADFCIGDSCRNKKHTGFVFFFKISFLCILCPGTAKKRANKHIKTLKKNLFYQYYLIRSWSKSSWTRFGQGQFKFNLNCLPELRFYFILCKRSD